MRIIDTLKKRAKILKQELTALYYAYQNPEMPLLSKAVVIFTLGYALSPIDLIPDFIPVLGYLDDILIIPALIALSIRLIPKKVMAEAREKAEREPVSLRKNWLFGVLFILIWVSLLVVILL